MKYLCLHCSRVCILKGKFSDCPFCGAAFWDLLPNRSLNRKMPKNIKHGDYFSIENEKMTANFKAQLRAKAPVEVDQFSWLSGYIEGKAKGVK